MPIEVTVEDVPITVSASGTAVQATVSGGQGPQGPAGPAGEGGVSSATAPLTYDAETQTVALSSGGILGVVDDELVVSGGAMPANATITFSDGTSDAEIGGWGFGVELTADNTVYATVEPSAVQVHSATSYASLQASSVYFGNGTSLAVGSFDAGLSGYNGISLNCAVGVELNWQAGHLKATTDAGVTAANILCDSPLEFPGEGADNVQIDATGITFGDGSTQTAAWTGSATFSEVADTTTYVNFNTTAGSLADALGGIDSALTDRALAADFDQGVKTTDAPTFQNLTIGGGLGIYGVFLQDDAILRFRDDTEQTTAWPGSLTYTDVGAAAASHTHSATADLTFAGATAGQVLTVNSGATALVWATPSTYSLPIASGSTLGGVKIGSGVSIDGSGVISVSTAYAATSHTHGNITNAGAIGSTSGLPVITTTSGVLTTGAFGTSSGQFAAGDHTHSQLHDRSHAVTSTSDHTANNWKVFYSNGSGQVVELALGSSGQYLTANGTAAAPTFTTPSSGGSTNVWISASAFIPRTTNGPGVDSRETSTNKQNFDEVLFDAAAIEYADALVILPSNYNNSTVTARFYWTAASGSGDVVFAIAGRAFANDDALDTAYGTAQSATDTLLAANDMHVSAATSAMTLGGTPAANTPAQFTVYRDATNAGDTLAVDARLLGVEIIYTAA